MADIAISMVECGQRFPAGRCWPYRQSRAEEELVNELEKAITNYMTEQTQGFLDKTCRARSRTSCSC